MPAEPSPQKLARIGGVLYLAIIAIGLFGELVVRGRVFVSGDAAATAANLRTMETLWRFGIASELVLLVCAIPLTLIFYLLLRPVSRNLALLAVLFAIVSIAVEAVATLDLVAALFTLGSAKYLAAFEPAQLDAMVSLAVKSHTYGFGAALVFFGVECVILGYLIRRSGYLPKLVGTLMQIAGLCYLVNSFSLILAPDFASNLFPAIALPILAGEGSLCLWLIVKGVDVEKWRERAGVNPI
jgi:hypothetical protein